MIILIVFNPVAKLRDMRMRRLIESTPLLEGFEHLRLDAYELRRIHKKRNRCKLIGHIWELDTVESPQPYTYTLSCFRCFPHIHSRRIVRSYNLFTLSEKEQD